VVVRDVVSALCFMHSLNTVHRDVKTDNMLLTRDAVVKLCDFGTSVAIGSQSQLKTLAGTPYFIAPEVNYKSTVGCCCCSMN
jgi:serine/threonine protein kinase